MIKTPTLLAGWRFEGNANDWSGGGYNGTVYGATLAAGRFGQCYSFTLDDYIGIGTNAAFSIQAADFTVRVVIKFNSTTQKYLMSKVYQVAIPVKYEWSIGTLAGVIIFRIYKNTGDGAVYASLDSISTINDNNQHDVAFTWDVSETTLKCYIDGVLESTTSTTAGTKETSRASTLFDIGWMDQETGTYWEGLIDEVQIFTSCLTAGEIRALMLGYSPGE